MREQLTANPQVLGEVLGNGKRYVVPSFQRDYAWEEAEWSELWEDLLAAVRAGEGARHFLGALVLQPSSERSTFYVIDGQQRLVTVSVLALAVIVRIEQLAAEGVERAQNLERARVLREHFVSTKDAASLQHRSRLKLNQQDDGFYQLYLVQGRAPTHPNRLKGSEAKLYRCFTFFSAKIVAHLDGAVDSVRLANFLELDLASRLEFIEIRVENDETAFSVFETLNARGVALGTADLLKNYLFACANRGGSADLEQARIGWNLVVRSVAQERVATLLFHKLASEVRELREKRVFAEVKQLVPKLYPVADFLDSLKSSAELYAALEDPNDEFWQGVTPGARVWVRVLKTLNVEQYKSVALAAFEKLADRPDKLERLLRNLAMISVRAAIAKVNTGDLARSYQTTAYRVAQGELKSPSSITRALVDVTPSDEDFQRAFETLAIDPRGRRKGFLRYLLSKLESDVGGVAVDFDASDVTIEHILPENPTTGWSSFSHEEHARDVVRLGNLTPLESGLNRALGAATFERKRAVYPQSRYALTRAIDAAEWTPEAIRARQVGMAQRAVTIWRVLDEGDR